MIFPKIGKVEKFNIEHWFFRHFKSHEFKNLTLSIQTLFHDREKFQLKILKIL